MRLIRWVWIIVGICLLFPVGCGKKSATQPETPEVFFSGIIELPGTWCANLDTGTRDCDDPGADVWWRQVSDVVRYWVPMNDAEFAVWGPSRPTYQDCRSAELSDDPINGSDNASNRIPTGMYLCGRTDAGRTTIVRILRYGYDLLIEVTTYQR